MTDQRDHLLQKYVGSQRLALSAVNAQNERAKFKTLSKWMGGNAN